MLQERTIADKMDRQLTHRGAARSLSAMGAMLAHEIKNPLSGIRGAAQLLETAVGDEDRALCRLICDETDRIVNLVERMEAFSDGRPVERSAVNIHEILEHVRRIAQAGFARRIRFVENYDPSLPHVLANRDQLVQVFLNLVKNAAEAIGDDAVDGEIELTTAFRPGVRIRTPGTALPCQPAAGILRARQWPRRAGRSDAASVRPLCHHKNVGFWPRTCIGRQDRRRSRRGHRMQIASTQNGVPHPDAGVFPQRWRADLANLTAVAE